MRDKLNALAEMQETRTLPADLDALFREHHRFVYRAAYRITGNAQDAEDVLQTVFIRLVRREQLPDFSPNPRGYLHRAAVNASLDIVKARKRGVQTETEARAPHAAAFEVQEALREAIAALHPKSAEIFVLRHVEGYGNGEIAKMIGTSPGVIAVTLFRARLQLKRSIRTAYGRNGKRGSHEPEP